MRDSFNKRAWISLYIIGILIFSTVILVVSQSAAGQSDNIPVPSSRVAALTTEEIDPVMLQKKLDQIYKNQENISEKFKTILDEIKIVKIRATVR